MTTEELDKLAEGLTFHLSWLVKMFLSDNPQLDHKTAQNGFLVLNNLLAASEYRCGMPAAWADHEELHNSFMVNGKTLVTFECRNDGMIEWFIPAIVGTDAILIEATVTDPIPQVVIDLFAKGTE